MLSPRFMFLATSMPGPVGSGRAVPVHIWRLVAGNNRVLGCGPVTYPDDEACRAAVARLLRDLPSAVPEPGPHSRPGRWRWQLVVPPPLEAAPDLDAPQRLLAVSARSYERQRSSRDNVEQFLAAAPVATVSTALVVRPRPRPWSNLDATGLVPEQAGATPPLVTDRRWPVTPPWPAPWRRAEYVTTWRTSLPRGGRWRCSASWCGRPDTQRTPVRRAVSNGRQGAGCAL